MDFTLELFHGYTFFKLADYRLLFFLLFSFLLSFLLSFFPKLFRPSMLGFWTFTIGYINKVFPTFVFSFFSLFLGFFLDFFVDSLEDWSKLNPFIKMRELWTIVNSWNLYPSMVFEDDGFAQMSISVKAD